MMVRFAITDHLLEKYSSLIDKNSSEPYAKFYQTLADIFFKINDELEIETSHFIAKDKFPRVRFCPEKIVTETKQQILFFYNPLYHTSQNAFYRGDIRARKITLLYLVNGEEIRVRAANFHGKVKSAMIKFCTQIGITKEDVRVSDHQHLTYDLFAKDKGVDTTQVHKFRSMTNRYLPDAQSLPENTNALTHVMVDFPINRRVRSLVNIDVNATDRYSELYNLIADTFISAAKDKDLLNGAVIANDLVPIVRSAKDENVVTSGEMIMLGYNPRHTAGSFTCKWDSNKLVNTVQLIIVASDHDRTSHGYGKFINQVEQALRTFSQQLGVVKDKEQILVRLHQHIGFYPD